MNANDKINLMIMANIANGMTLVEAFDAVIGEGAYRKFAGELYDALRAAA